MKIDNDGVEQWSDIYPLSNVSEARKVIVLNDGGYLVIGRALISSILGSNSSTAFRTDGNGNLMWYNYYRGDINNEANSVVLIDRNNAMIVGNIDAKSFVMTIELLSGQMTGLKLFNDNFFAIGYDIIRAGNNYYWVGGVSNTSASTTDVVVNKIRLPLE